MRPSLVRLLTSLVALCLLAPAAAKAGTLSGTSSAVLSNDPGFEGLYLYTVELTWSLDQNDPGHFDLFLDVEAFDDTCNAGAVLFPDPAGTSNGVNGWGDPCDPVEYSGEFLCKSDPSTKQDSLGLTVKYEPIEANCQTHVEGSGTFQFYSALEPGPRSLHREALLIKHGQSLTFGDLTGVLPGTAGEPLAARVLINEFLVRPGPGTGEFVEVFNNSGESISLEGWQIEIDDEFIIPLGDTLPPGGHKADTNFVPSTRVLIDFDFTPNGNAIPAGSVVNFAYSDVGVTFQDEPGPQPCGSAVYANSNQPSGFGSPPNVVSLCPEPIASDISEGRFGAILAFLNQGANEVCIEVRPNDPDDRGVLRAYDSGGGFLGQVLTTPGIPVETICLTSDQFEQSIWSVRFSGFDTTFARFDNLEIDFQEPPFPIPPIEAPEERPLAAAQAEEGNFLPDEGGTVVLRNNDGEVEDEVRYGMDGGAPISAPLVVLAGTERPPGFKGRRGGFGTESANGAFVAAEDETLSTSTQRTPDGQDTGNDAEDFNVGPPTADSANSGEAQPPALGSSIRVNGVYAAGTGTDAVEFFNPTGEVVDVSGWHLSDGSVILPVFTASSSTLLETGQKVSLLQGGAGSFDFELDFEDVLYLYDENLVRLDQVGWSRVPALFPDSCIVRSPDGAGPADGYDWPTSGGDVNLFYEPCALQSPTVDVPPGAPARTWLARPFPNPARGAAEIAFTLAGGNGPVELDLSVYDVSGRRVRLLERGRFLPGTYRLQWDGRDDGGRTARPGVYFVRLRGDAERAQQSRSLIWLR